MLLLQFALLTLDGAVYSKPMQSTARSAQSVHCTMQYAKLSTPFNKRLKGKVKFTPLYGVQPHT